jgi:hypothetical protein
MSFYPENELVTQYLRELARLAVPAIIAIFRYNTSYESPSAAFDDCSPGIFDLCLITAGFGLSPDAKNRCFYSQKKHQF